MKRHTLAITLIILLLLLGVVCLQALRNEPSGTGPSHPASGQAERPHQVNAKDGGRTQGNRQGNANSGLHELGNPKPATSFSSTVTAEIQAGETLVMGGYRTPDGNHEFTMLTPTLVTMEDGSQRISMASKALSISPDLARKLGLDTLTTGYATADQHAEAWSQAEMLSIIRAISHAEGTQFMSAPSVSSLPGEKISLNVGSGNGPSYAITTTANTTDHGGFSMHSIVERNTGEEP